MANHEFGIMKNNPKHNKRYDEYEPEKYKLVKINDDLIDLLLPDFDDIPCYWHTLERPEMNLAYYGISLIPPESMDAFLIVFNQQSLDEYKEITLLFKKAKRESKYIIHYGL